MRIGDMNWMQVEAYLASDDRAVFPIGITEQHAYLSLATDLRLAETIALDAAEPLGIPVFPVLPYGITPHFSGYPGTITLRAETFATVVREVLDSMANGGFRRILIVNGHGGNAPVQASCEAWAASREGVRVRFHNWWRGPRTWQKVQSIAPASHASWMEGFAWTRVEGVTPPPSAKPMVDWGRISVLDPAAIKRELGDGSFGGEYQRPESDMDEVWAVAVAETRALLEDPWE